MGNEQQIMDLDHEEQQIRQDMEETRSSLTEKLETLEQKVSDKVEEAASAVSETITSVKDVVEGTVDTVKDSVAAVKDTFDVPRQVDRHPWAVLGGSVMVGFLLGRLGSSGAKPSPQVRMPATEKNSHTPGNGRLAGVKQRQAPPSTQAATSSLLGSLTQQFGPEIGKLKGLAIGTLLGLVRDMVQKTIPSHLTQQVGEIIDGITTKLGGEPISGPVGSHFTEDDSSPTNDLQVGTNPGLGMRPTPF